MVLLRWWLSKKWWLASGNILRKVKERLKTSNYMMEAPTNYLRHNKKSWTAAYQVTTFFSIDLQKIWSSRDVDCEFLWVDNIGEDGNKSRQVMAHCWARQPRARPSFPHLAGSCLHFVNWYVYHGSSLVLVHSWGGTASGRGEGGSPTLQVEKWKIFENNLEMKKWRESLPHRQAWAEAKQGKENSRRASLAKSLQESLRTKSRPASPEYEVSLATASYEYDVVAS